MSKKKLTMILLALSLCATAISGCGSKKTITIYSCAEEKCLELTQKMLDQKFPEYDIRQTYMDTGSLAAKLAAEGTKTPISSWNWNLLIWKNATTALPRWIISISVSIRRTLYQKTISMCPLCA